MGDPVEAEVPLPAGTFRTLEWAGSTGHSGHAVLLHGLSGVADVWSGTVDALVDGASTGRPRCIAMDQRGHGHSPHTPGRYRIGDHVGDVVALIDRLGAPVRLVGHSMGARVAMVTAARHPDRVSSLVVVDIGPEAWSDDIERTSRLFRSMPERFPDRTAALTFGELYSPTPNGPERFVTERLRAHADGSYTWLASVDGLVETVTAHRRRNYWSDWESLSGPTLLVRGGTSRELRPRVVEQMRRRNPRAEVVEIDGVGHNVPLLAPTRLAEEIGRFWGRLPVRRGVDPTQRQ